MSLGLACTRAGLNAQAAEVLREQLALSDEGPGQAALMERLGLAYLGAGNQVLARRELGAALARGSSNAGVVLGMLAFRQGRPEAARALFRSILDEEPAQSWAHRGWGLSMLPAPDAAAAPR
jgi:Flp pilus assembly protein TadD